MKHQGNNVSNLSDTSAGEDRQLFATTSHIALAQTPHKLKTVISRGLYTVGMAAILAACSGASNNLGAPAGGSGSSGNTQDTIRDGQAYKSCSTNCIPTEIALEPIKSLNYSCGDVNDVTEVNAVTSCPVDTTMNVFIQNPGGTRKVELGSVNIRALAVTNATPLNRVSLLELSGKTATSATDANAKRAVNMIRLLDALRGPNNAYNDFAPINQMEINKDYKANMDELLTEDVLLTDFDSDSFIEKTSAWLLSHGLSVSLSEADAQKRLDRSLNVLSAGLYYREALLSGLPGGITAFSSGLNIGGATTANADEVIYMSIYAQALREGATVGQGMHWQNVATTPEARFETFVNARFDKMRVISPENAKFNPFNNKIQGYVWRLFDTDSNGVESPSSTTVDFNQGQLINDFAVVGTTERYREAFQSSPPSEDVLGAWTQSGDTPGTGQATITKQPNALLTTFLEPSVWLSENSVAKGQHYVFPLHATLKFTYGNDREDFDKGELGITILENGDIITDGQSQAALNAQLSQVSSDAERTEINAASAKFITRYPDCKPAVINQNSGMYEVKVKDKDGNDIVYNEKRIGTIRASVKEIRSANSAARGSFINPSIMLTGAEFGQLDGIQLGTRSITELTTINVDEAVIAAIENDSYEARRQADPTLPERTKLLGGLTINDINAGVLQGSASWQNIYNRMTFFYVNNRGTTYQPTAAERNALEQLQGNVTIRLSDCYEARTRPES